MIKDIRDWPEKIGPYQVDYKIASGGMAEIFLTRFEGISGFEKRFAVKRIHTFLARNPEFEEMFIREAKLAARLNHPNIVQVIDFGYDGECYYIVMEYIDGKDLRKIIRELLRRKRLLSVPHCCYLMQKTAAALDYAHRFRNHEDNLTGIVHRDVSPQNILVSYSGEVKLTDFGVALMRTGKSSGDESPDKLKGKIAYMSPEQSLGKELNHQSDIFSLGAVFFEIVTGQRLFYSKSDAHTLENLRHAAVPDPDTIDPAVPAELSSLIRRTLQRNTNNRLQSARILRDELSELAIKNQWLNVAGELGELVNALFLKDYGKDATSPVHKASRPIPQNRINVVVSGVRPAASLERPVTSVTICRPEQTQTNESQPQTYDEKIESDGSLLKWNLLMLISGIILLLTAFLCFHMLS